MTNIIVYITKNIEEIANKIKELKIGKKNKTGNREFKMAIKNTKEYYLFNFKGEGTYGMVFKVKNYTNNEEIVKKGKSIIVKIMKTKSDEVDRCREIKRRILQVSKSKNNEAKMDLIDKYTTKIIDIKHNKGIDLLFFEYLRGEDLRDYLEKNKLRTNEINNIYLQCLVSVKVFHRLLGFSHRDLKLENLFYDSENNTVKVIDYGFACPRDDKDCFNVYQGTPKYSHLVMNKKVALKYSKKRGRNNNNSGLGSITNNNKGKSLKKKYSYPDAVAQDLFSLIIILFKIYYIQNRKKSGELYKIISDYENSFRKDSDKYLEKKRRYKNKKLFLKKLFEIKTSKIDNQAVFMVISIIKNYWNPKKNDFTLNNLKSESVSTFIFDMIIYSLLPVVKNHSIANQWKNLVRL
jgi:serine/threonine protein kinase